MNNKTGYRKERHRGKGGRERDIEIDLHNGQVLAYAVLCACAKSKNVLSYIGLVTNYAPKSECTEKSSKPWPQLKS